MSTTVGCLGKFAYGTRADADRAKRHIHEKPNYLRGGQGRVIGALQTYHCRKCGRFHLGRNKQEGRRELPKTADHHAGNLKSRKAKYEALTE